MEKTNPRRPIMHTTLKDIARETGFSINTVSRALRNDSFLSEKTRKKINDAAEQLGYIQNNLAYSLRTGSSQTISIIAGDIANPYFSIFIKGIEKIMEQHGYTVLVLNSNEDETKELAAIKTSLNKKVDGILICPVQKTTDNILYLKKFNTPFVLFGRHFNQLKTNYVIPDEKQGGYLAAKYLIDHGHRNILFLIANEYISSSGQRLTGCKLAFTEAGLCFPPENVYHFNIASPDLFNRFVTGEVRLDSITAILCFSDVIGHECIFALKSLGKKVPEDISIVGFDDIQSMFVLSTALTSVASKEKIASPVAELLIEKMHSDDGKYRTMVLDVVLSPGETVADLAVK